MSFVSIFSFHATKMFNTIEGGAIVARGITAGPAVARILQRVEAQWVAEGFPDSARIAALLDAALAEAAPDR
jgi:poly(A) polymerase